MQLALIASIILMFANLAHVLKLPRQKEKNDLSAKLGGAARLGAGRPRISTQRRSNGRRKGRKA
jgi:hypothetical protein